MLPYGRINVLLPIPISKYYEYLNKDILLSIGDLVEVPFGKRFLPALVIGSVEGQIEVSKLKKMNANSIKLKYSNAASQISNYALSLIKNV